MGRSRKTAYKRQEDPRSGKKALKRLRQRKLQRKKTNIGLPIQKETLSPPFRVQHFHREKEAPEERALLYGVVLYLKAPDEKAPEEEHERYQKRKQVVFRSILETLLLLKPGETFLIAANKSLPSDIVAAIKNACDKKQVILRVVRSHTDVVDPGRQRARLARIMVKHDPTALYVISDDRRVVREPGLEGKKQNPREIRKQLFNEHKYGMLGSPQSWRSKNASGVPLQTFIFDSSFLESYPNFFKPGYLFEDFASLLGVPIYINRLLKRYAYTAPSILRRKGTPFPSVWNNEGAMIDIINNVLPLIRSGKLVVREGKVLFNFENYKISFDGSFRLHMLILVASQYAGILDGTNFRLNLPDPDELDEKTFARDAKLVWKVLKKKGPMSRENFTQKEVCAAIRKVTSLILRERSDRIVNEVGQSALAELSSVPVPVPVPMAVCKQH